MYIYLRPIYKAFHLQKEPVSLEMRTTDKQEKWESDKHIVGFDLFIVDSDKYINLPGFSF